MFAVKYALQRLFIHRITAIAVIGLVALASAAVLHGAGMATAMRTAESQTFGPLEKLGADLIMVRHFNEEAPSFFVDDLAEGMHENGQSVYNKKNTETKDSLVNLFESFGVPTGIAGKFTDSELKTLDANKKIKHTNGILLASYNSTWQKQKKIVIPEESIQPKTFKLDPKEEVELEQKAHNDPAYKRMAEEQLQILAKPEAEMTDSDQNRINELADSLGRRKLQVYHELRPDVFDVPPKRKQKIIEPPAPQVATKEYNVAGMEPGVGYLKAADVTDGRYFSKNDKNAPVAILRADFAKQKQLQPGDTLNVLNIKYKVIGIGRPSMTANAPESYVPLATLQEQLNARGVLNIVFIKAQKGADVGPLTKELAAAFPDAELSDNNKLAKKIKPSIKGSAAVLARFSQLLAAVLVSVVVGVIALMGLISTRKRSKEIATLRAIGWPGRKVGLYLALDTSLNTAIGVTLGILLALGLALRGSAQAGPEKYDMYGASHFFGFLGGQVEGNQLAQIDIPLVLSFSAIDYMKVIMLAITLAALSSLITTWRVKKIKPAEVLRQL